MNEHVSCPFGIFTFTSRYFSGREGRVAFGLLRYGAPVFSTPKDPSCQLLPRTNDPLSIRSRPVSPGRRVIAADFLGSPSIYHPRPVRSRGRGKVIRKLSASPPIPQRLQPTRFRRLWQGVGIPSFPSPASAAYRSSDSLVSYQPESAASTPCRESVTAA